MEPDQQVCALKLHLRTSGWGDFSGSCFSFDVSIMKVQHYYTRDNSHWLTLAENHNGNSSSEADSCNLETARHESGRDVRNHSMPLTHARAH